MQCPKFSSVISDFVQMMEEASKDYAWNYEEVNRMDRLTQDYLHKLELDNLDYKERAKVATQLAQCRQARRACKDTVKEDKYERNVKRGLGIVRAAIVGLCIVIFAIAMLVGGVKIIDQTEVGIVKTFGRVDHAISGGLNFVNPISDTVEVMDLRVHVREASFASYTKDAQPLTAAIEYQYEPIAAQAMNIVSQYGSYEIMEQKL